jgi:uncharacterized membrane protein YfcA
VIAGVGVDEYVVLLAVVTLGALVQGGIGFGAGMIAVPVLAVVAPEALPVTMLAWAAPLNVAVALRERDEVDRAGVGWVTLGRLPGTALGAWVVGTVAAETVSVLAGGALLVAVATSVASLTVTPTSPAKVAAGFVSGAMSAATSLGGPALALLYQREEGPTMRSTLGVNLTLGVILSLGLLAATGAVRGHQVALALALQPGLVLGLALSRPLARYLDRGWLRPTVLGCATVGAVGSILNGL